MPRYRTTIESSRSIHELFSYFKDFSNSQAWDPGVVRASCESNGTIGLGSAFLVSAKFNQRVMDLRYVITEFEEPHRLVFEASIPAGRSVDTVTFSARNHGCALTYDASLVLDGWWRLTSPILSLLFRRTGNAARAGMTEVLNP